MVSNSVAIEIKPNSPTTTPGKEEKIRHACPLEGIDFPNFDLTCHFFVRHTLSEMENFKFQFYVAY